jgi:hypothetical protein
MHPVLLKKSLNLFAPPFDEKQGLQSVYPAI